jgi:hypothetical protein
MPFLNRFSNRLLLIKNYDHRVASSPAPATSYFLGGISFDGGSSTALESIIVDSSGNFYACGAIGADCLVLKFNSSGAVLWQRNLSEGGVTIRGKSIAVDGSGNVYVGGSYSYAGNEQIRIFKLDSSGALVFKKGIYRGNNTTTTAESISVDSSGNIYLCGYTDLNGYNFYVAKLSTLGAVTYQFNFGGASSFDLGTSLKLASSGNFYVAGSCGDSSIFGPLIGKYNDAGSRQWQRRLNTGASTPVNLALDSDENVYASYIARPTTGTITNDYGIAKYNTSGTIQWQKRLNSTSSDDQPASISVDAEGNIYIFGNTTINDGSIDFFLVKLDTSGAVLWQRTLRNSPSFTDDRGLEVALDSSGNIYISGTSGTSSIFAKVPNDGSKTGTYLIDGGRSLIYASATSFTSPNTTFTASSVTLTNAGPALTLFDSFETIATPSPSITVVTL